MMAPVAGLFFVTLIVSKVRSGWPRAGCRERTTGGSGPMNAHPDSCDNLAEGVDLVSPTATQSHGGVHLHDPRLLGDCDHRPQRLGQVHPPPRSSGHVEPRSLR